MKWMSDNSDGRARLRLVGGTATPRVRRRALGPAAELADGQLVALARDGHREAFEALYRRHVGFALNLAVRIQGNATDVEDVVHDAFIRAQHRMAELGTRSYSAPGSAPSSFGSCAPVCAAGD